MYRLLFDLGHLKELFAMFGVAARGKGCFEVIGLGGCGSMNHEGVLDSVFKVLIRLVDFVRLS